MGPKDSEDATEPSNAAYERALEIAEDALDGALKQAGETDFLVAIMMIEAAVNAACERTSDEDVVRLLRDLVEQIESGADDD